MNGCLQRILTCRPDRTIRDNCFDSTEIAAIPLLLTKLHHAEASLRQFLAFLLPICKSTTLFTPKARCHQSYSRNQLLLDSTVQITDLDKAAAASGEEGMASCKCHLCETLEGWRGVFERRTQPYLDQNQARSEHKPSSSQQNLPSFRTCLLQRGHTPSLASAHTLSSWADPVLSSPHAHDSLVLYFPAR